jgi:acylphosphatase
LRGFVFNDPDGSIKIVCCGDNGIITNFLEELADIGRKLDKRNELLTDIKKDTSSLPGIKYVLDSYIGEQREHNQWMKEHNQWMKEHNQRLERILEKLAER